MNLDVIKANLIKTKTEKGTSDAILQLLLSFGLTHSNFEAIVFRDESQNKQVVVTTEGNFGESEKQLIRVPKNILDFPLDFVAHLLAHEFIHIEQRARPDYSASREEREFEAYYHGVFPTKYNLPPCPDWLRLQFCKSIEKYYTSMGFWTKRRHRKMFKEVLEVKSGLEK